MQKFLADLFSRLSSRKFIITIGGITVFVTVKLPPEAYAPIVALIGAYLASEGAGDVVQRFQNGKTATAALEQKTTLIQSGAIDPDPVDKNIVTPGSEPASDIAM